MPKYTLLRPVAIEAVQYDGDNIDEILKFTGCTKPAHIYQDKSCALPGTGVFQVGDFIIKENNSFYPKNQADFKRTYREVTQ